MPTSQHARGPMPHTRARHLLHPLRGLILSPGALARRLDLPEDAQVLEVGPGPGYFSVAIARTIPQGTLWLLDIQAEMLAMARERLERLGVANVRYLQGDAMQLPMEDGSFDAAFLAAVLGELPDPERGLEEIHRVLKPSGLLSVTEQAGDPDALALPQVEKLLRRAGFRVERTFGRGLSFTVNARR